MKFEINSRWDSTVLFTCEAASLLLAVEAAVKEGANLEGANLRGANLEGANLRGADLEGAYLEGTNGIEKFPIQILGHKHAMWTTQDGQLQIGCHKHSFDKWLKKAEKIGALEDYSPLDIEIYKLHIAHIEQASRLLWNQKQAAEEKEKATA